MDMAGWLLYKHYVRVFVVDGSYCISAGSADAGYSAHSYGFLSTNCSNSHLHKP